MVYVKIERINLKFAKGPYRNNKKEKQNRKWEKWHTVPLVLVWIEENVKLRPKEEDDQIKRSFSFKLYLPNQSFILSLNSLELFKIWVSD